MAACSCPARSGGSLADQRLEEAYLAVGRVAESRGESGYLVELLNLALEDLEAGADPGLVVAQLDAVIMLAGEEAARGRAARDASAVVAGAQVAAAVALAYASWVRLPRLFWRGWLRVRGGWLVEHEGG